MNQKYELQLLGGLGLILYGLVTTNGGVVLAHAFGQLAGFFIMPAGVFIAIRGLIVVFAAVNDQPEMISVKLRPAITACLVLLPLCFWIGLSTDVSIFYWLAAVSAVVGGSLLISSSIPK